MPNVKNIKTKLYSVKSRKNIAYSMLKSNTRQLKRIDKQIDSYKDFMSDFFSIVGYGVNPFGYFTDSNAHRSLLIAVSADKNFSGEMNNKMFKDIKSKYSVDKPNIDVFCIGKKSLEYFVREGFNIVGYVKINDEFSHEDLVGVSDYILSSFKSKLYNEISLIFNMVCDGKKVKNYKLYPMESCCLKTIVDDLGISFATEYLNNGDNIDCVNESSFQYEVAVQLSEYMVYGAVLQTKKAELRNRIGIMKGLADTAEFVTKDLTLSFNKAYQLLLANEVSNIMSLKMTY